MEYIAWLRQQDMSHTKGFWRNLLKGLTALTSIGPSVKIRSTDKQQMGYGELEIHLSQVTSSLLRSLTHETQVSLATLLKGAWALLLSRYNDQEDVLFGTVVDNGWLSMEAEKSVVGPLTSTLPFRAFVSPEKHLIPWMKELRRLEIDIQENACVSPGQLHEWS